jgi:hypothetical protein
MRSIVGATLVVARPVKATLVVARPVKERQ